MLKFFEVGGFKSIRNSKLEFGRINLFIGGNGSGKSNLLEALGLFSASLKDISDIELQRRGVRLSVPTLFKSAFKNSKLRSQLTLSGSFDNNVEHAVSIKAGESIDGLRFFSESIKHKGRLLMGRSENGITVQGISTPKIDIDPSRGLWDRFRESIELPEELEIELNRMASYAIYAPQTAFLRGTEVESVPVQPIGLQGSGIPQAASVVLRSVFGGSEPKNRLILADKIMSMYGAPGWTSRFRVKAYKPETTTRLVKTGESSLYLVDKFMAEKRNELSAYDSSEGSLYLLFMAVLLLHPRAPKVFALDNVDNALNPAITRKLLDVIILSACSQEFRDANLAVDQVFMTSHNPTSLDAFDLFDDQQRVFVVRRSSSGETYFTRLQPRPGMTKADWARHTAGRHLSEFWIDGQIEGALGI